MSGWVRELFFVNMFADSEREGDTSICTAWCADSERVALVYQFGMLIVALVYP